MKKVIVLVVLFALPIVAYLFFAAGVNKFAKLPVLTENIETLDAFTPLHEGDTLQLKEKITVLSFLGNATEAMEGNAFNLNEKIYKKNYPFYDFQFVVIAEKGTQDQAEDLLNDIGTYTDTSKWKFAFGSNTDIDKLFNSLHTDFKLNDSHATPYVFIIDKNRNLRGRDGEMSESGEDEFGYDTRSVAQLSDEMTDDIKVILAEYRLALKKYNKKEK